MNEPIKFLELLDNKAEKFLFACFDYRKEKKGRTLYGSFEESQSSLQKLNNSSFCVYVTVNETQGDSRKKASIKRARAIWVEDDEYHKKPRSDFPLKPSMIVESSPGKYHYYWLTSTTKFDEWDAVMATMVEKWGCDNKAKDLARVMRLPGFQHNKDLTKDIVCRLVDYSGQSYSWLQIKATFPPAKQSNSTESKPDSGKFDEQEAIKDLLSSQNYHGSLTSLAMKFTNMGMARETQKTVLYGLMCAIPVKKRREEWEHRAGDEHLYECIDSAIRKKGKEDEEIDLSEVTPDQRALIEDDNIEFPPGLMGELCNEIVEMAPYQNKAVALSGGMGLVAGISGRKFNVLGMGLNLYIAILADSGIGKANLKDSINKALRGNGGPLNLGATFAGRSRFTGPKAIFDMLQSGLSRICVIEEAGLINESSAGDQSGISRVMLDLFTSSGHGKWAGDEGYSDKKNSIPALHSPALSVVSVSTPKSFLKALKSKSADVSGEVARLWMIRTMGFKPYMNRKRRKEFSKAVSDKIGELIKICTKVQLPEVELDVTDIEVAEMFFDDADEWVDLENKYLREGDTLRRTLCSRAFAKSIKMAAICSLFNDKENIGVEEYKWAKQAVLKELDFIQDTFTHESSDDLSAVAKGTVGRAIIKILHDEYKAKKQSVPEELRKANMVTYYALHQVTRNSSVLRDIDDDTSRNNPKTGLEKVLSHMVSSGLLIRVPQEKLLAMGIRAKMVYQATSDFKLLMEN